MTLPIDHFATSSVPIARAKLLWLQMTLSTFAAVTATFAPPDQGAMMLVPLAMEPAAAVNLAIGHGSTILGNGPLPGSIIVQGNRDVLQPLLLRNGVLLLAAAPFLCGKSSDQIGSGQ